MNQDMNLFQLRRRGQGLRAVRAALFGWIAWICVVGAALTGCSTIQPFTPQSVNENRFRDRSKSDFDDDVRVTVAVPNEDEAESLFGTDLGTKEIQPIWVKVENHSDHTYYLITAAVDQNYFSPMEAAFTASSGFGGADKNDIERHFRLMSFRNPVLPHTAVSGFIFTNLDEGEKILQIDLIANQQIKFFTFFVQIPGMRVDYQTIDFKNLYTEDQIQDLDLDGLRKELESLPCCTTDKDQKMFGDPLNLVIVGDFVDVAAAFVRCGWLPAEETYSTAVWKTIKSFLFGSRYRYSPVSSLYFQGRHQDLARQKPRHDIHERNHLRLWYTPMRYKGKPVFVGQVSRDIGVRFTSKSWPPVTHKIDPDIDEARSAVVEDMLFSQTLATLGFVNGVGAARASHPRKNLTGDPYFTDGLRLVLFIEPGPISLEQIQTVKWVMPSRFFFD